MSMLSTFRAGAVLLSGCLLAAAGADAAISLSSTRLIYDGARNEASITVRNTGSPVLMQAWIDPGEQATDELPFAITPTLATLPPGQQQLLRIMYAGVSDLPADRESLFWLNVQEIPQVAEAENVLQFGIQHRIKMFFRPAGLRGEPIEATKALAWSVERQDARTVLTVSNPTAVHVTLVPHAAADDRSAGRTLQQAVMLAPGATAQVALAGDADPAPGQMVLFDSLSDYGSRVPFFVPLHSGKAVSPEIQAAP